MTDTDTQESPLVSGRYRLHRVLGRGGMGVVWAARDEILGREVAVKEVRPLADLSPDQSDDLRERTMREARTAARLTHPSVVRVYDVVEDEGRPWIVMELLDPRTLADLIAADGPLSPRAAARIGLELVDALRTAHRAGVLHRDVKPGNVMMSATGRAVLTDFGIARADDDPTLTQTGLLVGSPGYMSPERARGERPTAASDLWALGATLYAVVEGDPPFRRDGQLQTLHAVISEPLPAPLGAGPLRPLIERLLEKDPALRPSADETYDQLRRILDDPAAVPTGDDDSARQETATVAVAAPPLPPALSPAASSSPAPASTPMSRAGSARRRGPLLAVGAVVVLVLAAVGVVFLRPSSDGGELPVSAPSTSAGRSGAPAGGAPTSGSAGAAGTPSPSGGAPASGAAGEPRTTRVEPSPSSSADGSDASDAGGPVPVGWTVQRDPTGFSVAMPPGWTRSIRDGSTYFREPNGRAFLQVAQTSRPKADVLADWQTQASSAPGRFAGYRQVGIERVDYRGWDTADWEFTWQAPGGPLHVVNRNVRVSDRRAYALYWSVPEQDWQRRLADFDAFTRTFQPAP